MKDFYEFKLSEINQKYNWFKSLDTLKNGEDVILDPLNKDYDVTMDYTKYELAPSVSQIQGGLPLKSPEHVELHYSFRDFNTFIGSGSGKTILDFVAVKLMAHGVRVCYCKESDTALLEEGLGMYDFEYDLNVLTPFNAEQVAPTIINIYYNRKAS